MYAKTWGCVMLGIEARRVEIEIDINRGLPTFEIVGQPAAVVKESRDRIRSALQNSGFEFPTRRITVNLAPAHFRKDGSLLDLPIAIGVLIASKQLTYPKLNQILFAGELSLSGQLRPVPGILAAALLARQNQQMFIHPAENNGEISSISKLTSAGFQNLAQLVSALLSNQVNWIINAGIKRSLPEQDPWQHLGIVGGRVVRRCLQVAAAGRHNLALVGPPGVGKTLLARALKGMLPPLPEEESLEVAQIYSATGLSVQKILQGYPPVRAPHHTITPRGLVGGGSPIRPGEVTLAHRGLLFLDELPEFSKESLNAIREPLESKSISLHRSNQQVIFPADVQLVAALNLCPCGFYYFQPERCRCSVRDIARYLRPISGPIADRIDLKIGIAKPLWIESEQGNSDQFSVGIAEARLEIKKRRGSDLEQRLPQKGRQFLRTLASQRQISARGYFKLLSVASTIAALEGLEIITAGHLAEAWQYRWELSELTGEGGNSGVIS